MEPAKVGAKLAKPLNPYVAHGIYRKLRFDKALRRGAKVGDRKQMVAALKWSARRLGGESYRGRLRTGSLRAAAGTSAAGRSADGSAAVVVTEPRMWQVAVPPMGKSVAI